MRGPDSRCDGCKKLLPELSCGKPRLSVLSKRVNMYAPCATREWLSGQYMQLLGFPSPSPRQAHEGGHVRAALPEQRLVPAEGVVARRPARRAVRPFGQAVAVQPVDLQLWFPQRTLCSFFTNVPKRIRYNAGTQRTNGIHVANECRFDAVL